MSDPKGLRPRRAALAMAQAVLDQGGSLDAAKAGPALAGLTPPERARAGDLAASLLRWLRLADALTAPLMRRPLAPRAAVARDALRLAVVETGLGAPVHAAIDAAVELAKRDRASARLAGLVNAVARRACAAAPAAFAAPDAAARAAPDWLGEALRADWGAAAAPILAASFRDAPLDITGPADWADRLGATPTPSGTLRLPRGQVTALPGYEAGAWWVQDAAAALPARLFGEIAGKRALDLCAAPGGKTLQLAAAGARVTALDLSETRLGRLRENLARTGLAAETVAADARTWRPDAPFDVVLLDAPCSATGTLRRHPDLQHLKRAGDIAALVALQDDLLAAAWAMLAPGGTLVFCTCSLLRAEGEERAARFAATAPRAPIPPGLLGDAGLITAEGDLRTRPDFWPEIGGLDGFFAARFAKPA